METVVSIVLLVFAILQIILFFKVWGMTNRVNDIYATLYRQKKDAGDLEFNEFVEYLETNIRIAKRMRASEDKETNVFLKGILYDIENYFDNSNPYQKKNADKYRSAIEEIMK